MGMLALLRAPSTAPGPRAGGRAALVPALSSCVVGLSTSRRRNCWLFMAVMVGRRAVSSGAKGCCQAEAGPATEACRVAVGGRFRLRGTLYYVGSYCVLATMYCVDIT